MLTKKLKRLFLISILIFIAHITEELLAGLWNVDSLTISAAKYFQSIPQAIFVVFNLTFLIFLIIIALLIKGGKWIWLVMSIVGLIFVFELEHIIKALISGGYYPGLYTSFLFPIIGFFYWKELIKNFKQNK